MNRPPIIPSVRAQREQAKITAVRRVEQLQDLVSGYVWWIDMLDSINVAEGSAREHVRKELVDKLHAARRQAERAWQEEQATVKAITERLAAANVAAVAAARQQQLPPPTLDDAS